MIVFLNQKTAARLFLSLLQQGILSVKNLFSFIFSQLSFFVYGSTLKNVNAEFRESFKKFYLLY